MVIHIEYRSQRYSMGSSDPLPTGFQIRFGSLNFQDTGNGYLMRITNSDELHLWWSTGPGPMPVLTVYFGTPNMFITLWYGFVYGTNPPLGTLII
jgi:hypothetical protein